MQYTELPVPIALLQSSLRSLLVFPSLVPLVSGIEVRAALLSSLILFAFLLFCCPTYSPQVVPSVEEELHVTATRGSAATTPLFPDQVSDVLSEETNTRTVLLSRSLFSDPLLSHTQ